MGVVAILEGVAALMAANQAYEHSDDGDMMRPKPVAPEPEKQAQQTPEANVYRRRNANAAGICGPGSTVLTGLTGVSDSALRLGKHTLLGQ